jgi:DNA-binding XRE family transcriptional regulator
MFPRQPRLLLGLPDLPRRSAGIQSSFWRLDCRQPCQQRLQLLKLDALNQHRHTANLQKPLAHANRSLPLLVDFITQTESLPGPHRHAFPKAQFRIREIRFDHLRPQDPAQHPRGDLRRRRLSSKHRVTFQAAFLGKREAQRLSQESLAEKADLHPTYIGMVERSLRNPTLNVSEAIAKALRIPLSQLIAEAEAVQQKRKSS